LFGPYDKLLVYECMSFGNDGKQADTPCGRCPGLIVEFNTTAPFLRHNAKCATAVVCYAPWEKLKSAQGEGGWTVPTYSCVGKGFTDFTSSTSSAKVAKYGPFKSRPGASWFHRGLPDGSHKDTIYMTYNTYDRGVEDLQSFMAWIDRTPLNEGYRVPAHFDWDTLQPFVPK